MENIDPEVLEKVIRYNKIFDTVTFIVCAAMVIFVAVLIARAAWSCAKENGWRYTFQVAYLIAGGLAIASICISALQKMHSYVTAWVLVTTNGASADFCHGVATAAVVGVCVLVFIWLYMVYNMISK